MIKLGIIDYGGIAKTYKKALEFVPEFKLVSVLDINKEKEKIAKEVGANFYTLDKLKEFFESVEGVIIATPLICMQNKLFRH